MLMLRVVRPVETTLLYLRSWENCPRAEDIELGVLMGLEGVKGTQKFYAGPEHVRYWHKVGIPNSTAHVRFQG
jgi:hypothetical protein